MPIENATNWFGSLRKFKKINSESKEYLGSNGSTEGKYASVGEVNNISEPTPKVEMQSLPPKVLTEDEEDILEAIVKEHSDIQSLTFLLGEILKICLNDNILMSNIKKYNKFDIHNDTKENVFELMLDIQNSLKKIAKSMEAQDASITLIFSMLKNFDNKFYILSMRNKKRAENKETDYMDMNKGGIPDDSNYMTIDEIDRVYENLRSDTQEDPNYMTMGEVHRILNKEPKKEPTYGNLGFYEKNKTMLQDGSSVENSGVDVGVRREQRVS